MEILKVLKDEDLTALAHGMEEAYYEDKAYIIRQGLPGDDFYIVFKGQVDVFKKEGDSEPKQVKTCNPGDYFGELALLSEDMRAASCIANGPVTVLVLDRQHFEDMIGSLKWWPPEAGCKEERVLQLLRPVLQCQQFLHSLTLKNCHFLRHRTFERALYRDLV